jgi:hypothetical protein
MSPKTGLLWAALAAGILLIVAACGPSVAPAQPDLAPGTVELNQGLPNDTLLGGSGTGILAYHGQSIRFAISGVGVDGAAVAVLQTSGDVVNLRNLAGFPGTYRRAPAAPGGSGRDGGGLWLQNERRTMLHLEAPPQGRMPDIGNDAVRIVLDQ